MATIVTLHHKHMKLVKPFTPHVIACSIRKGFRSVDFLERKSRKRDCSV